METLTVKHERLRGNDGHIRLRSHVTFIYRREAVYSEREEERDSCYCYGEEI